MASTKGLRQNDFRQFELRPGKRCFRGLPGGGCPGARKELHHFFPGNPESSVFAGHLSGSQNEGFRFETEKIIRLQKMRSVAFTIL